MKKNITRALSIVLVLAMIFGYTVLASASPADTIADEKTEAKTDTSSKDTIDLDSIINTADADKQETVYVIAKADGSVEKVIVSELLRNPDNKASIDDVTDLKDIENVKSDAAYKLSGTSCVWDAQGEDIYYQGTTDKELPVTLSIAFKLDGKTVTADEINGASGKVEITFNYTNNQKESVEIDGKKQDIYVPFLMLSGMILDNENFKNVTVSNGKIIDDGDKTIVAGFAMPGMQENLGIDKDTFEIPDSVTVTADATDFSLATTLTVATNDIFNHMDLSSVDTIDELEEQLDTLDSATQQLMDGSSKLYDGLETLLGKSTELVNGVKLLADGAGKLSTGADSLYAGATQFKSKFGELNSGLAKLTSNSATLNAGAKKVFDSIIATVQSQLDGSALKTQLGLTIPKLTQTDYTSQLNTLIATVQSEQVKAAIKAAATAQAREGVAATVEESNEEITAGVTAAAKNSVLVGVLKGAGIASATEENAQTIYKGLDDTTKSRIDAAVNSQMESAEVKAKITAGIAAQKETLINQNMATAAVQKLINDGVTSTVTAAVTQLNTAKDSLDSYNEFYTGLLTYTAGVDNAASGSAQLYSAFDGIVSGSQQISENMKTLKDGINTLNTQTPALVDGVTALRDGAQQLADGTKEFYNTGVKKLVDAVKNDIAPVVTRLKATADVSKDYQSFGGISDDMTGSTKFIYRTESIEK